MFFTRPILTPLGIDLSDIEGGGSGPSQFFGRTSDGCPSYIRVAGEWFSNRFELVDLSSGAVIGTIQHPAWYSMDLLAWTRAVAGRYLYVYKDGIDNVAPHVGLRPVELT